MRAFLVLSILTLAACGSDSTAPGLLHVANFSYTEGPGCNGESCGGVIRFRLLDGASKPRAGRVTITGAGFEPTKGATTGSDGWGEADWGFDPLHRPYTITVCPEGVTDTSRCASGSTG